MLPEILVTKILLELPAVTIIRFKCVCKSWCSIIESESFIDQHLNKAGGGGGGNINEYVLVNGYMKIPEVDDDTTVSYHPAITRIFSYDTLEVVSARVFSPASLYLREEDDDLDRYFTSFWIKGCCNGLLLIVDRHNDVNYALWNPATGEMKVLPTCLTRSSSQEPDRDLVDVTLEAVGFGFGFNAALKDYKVVMMHKLENRTECTTPVRIVVEVYSLRRDSWREVATLSDPTTLMSFPKDDNGGVFNSNDGVYSWVANVKSVYGVRDEIVSFDMTKEVIVKTPLPNVAISTSGVPDACRKNMRRRCRSCRDAHEVYSNYVTVSKDSLALVNCVRRLGVPVGVREKRERELLQWDHSYYDIWVLGKCGVKESWRRVRRVKRPDIDIGCIRQFRGLWEDNKVWLTSYHPKFKGRGPLYLGELDGQELVMKRLVVHGEYLKPFVYRESLVSINGKNTFLIRREEDHSR